jgi:hypothetical protein
MLGVKALCFKKFTNPTKRPIIARKMRQHFLEPWLFTKGSHLYAIKEHQLLQQND